MTTKPSAYFYEILLAIFTAALLIYVLRIPAINPEKFQAVTVPIADTTPILEFGIPVDSMLVIKDEVESGQNLSSLLAFYGVPPAIIDQISSMSDSVFDVRKMKAGNPYTMICKNDGQKTPAYFIYESSKTEYVVFVLSDRVHVHTGTKEVETIRKTAEGVIESSLWNALSEKHNNPTLALDLSEVFAWTIDFYAIQKNDEFRVIYDELFVDGVSVGNGQIYAARFIHNGKVFNAYRYEQDGKTEYFNESGENLRRAFLKAPLRFSRISSRFSNSRLHPVLRIRRPHHGVDYSAPSGTPVQSIGDGSVIAAAYSGGAGLMVKIRHNSQYTSAYLHLSKYGKGVKNGSRVSQGQIIGYVGSTGLSTGPHLDFRVYKNGKAIDPLSMESPPAEPVKKENMKDFFKLIGPLKQELEKKDKP